MVKRLAAAGLIATVPLVALVKVPLLNRIVMFVAVLCDRLLNVTTPPTAVRLLVPCNVPAPDPRAAVTTVLLSPERKLPKAS
jgi:hypothetical protein